jgi:ribose transport system ATP-binding protein
MTRRPSKSSEPAALLQARGICKSFPGVQALDGVDLTVQAGTLHAVIGENGAGKSTLMNILAGVFAPDQGSIHLAGNRVRFRSPSEAQSAGISIIFQELNLIPNLSVAENIFLAREPRNRLGLVDYRKMHADAKKLLARLNAEIDPGAQVERLSVGAQQLVEIAKALSFDARIIIMDEPTSAITEQEIKSLFRLIQQLKQQGVGIIYITHKLDELTGIADDITILRDGRLVATKAFDELSHDELVRMMVGRELRSQTRNTVNLPDDEALRVERISLRHAQRPGDYVFHDVSFAVRRGEILGMFGLMGAGRTELLQTIFGLHPRRSSGKVKVDGSSIEIRSPRDAIRAGIALAPEDRKAEGLVLTMSAAENVSLACLERATRLGILQPNRERALVRPFMDRLSVKKSSLGQRVGKLSGGNQQKIVLSKWLAAQPNVLLLDEPTRGIDIQAKQEIYSIIDELAASGLAIVRVSSELPEILMLADRIVVLVEGRLAAEFARAEATEEMILKAALPAGKLQRAGFA